MEDKSTGNLADLLKKAQSGDQASLQVLCKELERYIRGYFWHKFQNNTIVDDLSQETYLRFLKNLMSIRDRMKLKSFVTKVAMHVMQDYFRRKYRVSEEGLEGTYESEEEHESRLKPEVVDQIIDSDEDPNILDSIDMENALNQLPEKSRHIITMKTKGYNYEEISAEVGLTVSGVKMQIKRSMEQLRMVLFNVTFLFISATTLLKHHS